MRKTKQTETIVETSSSIIINNLVDVDAVLLKVSNRCKDFNTFYNHYMSGTIDKYYTLLLTDIITDLTNIPVERNVQGLESLDSTDESEILERWRDIAYIISALFNKTQKSVENDMKLIMNKFPIEDVRNAKLQQRTIGLH